MRIFIWLKLCLILILIDIFVLLRHYKNHYKSKIFIKQILWSIKLAEWNRSSKFLHFSSVDEHINFSQEILNSNRSPNILRPVGKLQLINNFSISFFFGGGGGRLSKRRQKMRNAIRHYIEILHRKLKRYIHLSKIN